MPLASYHIAWLESRPHRSEAWLSEKISEGFDVHHIDGDHQNDAPDNLVLIERSDHRRLHNQKGLLKAALQERAEIKAAIAAQKQAEYEATVDTVGKRAYEHRITRPGWRDWPEDDSGYGRYYVSDLAKAYAKRHNKPWPLPKQGVRYPPYRYVE